MRKVSTSGLNSLEQKKASIILEAIGLKLFRNLTPDILFLIISKTGSPKVELAIKLNIPIIDSIWLEKSGKLGDLDSYRAKTFLGLTICCTQITVEERQSIQRSTIQRGGTFQSNLDSTCTHLISLKPEGDKYHFAKSCTKMKIVNPQWFYSCVKLGHWVSETPFQLQEHSQNIDTEPPKITHSSFPKPQRALESFHYQNHYQILSVGEEISTPSSVLTLPSPNDVPANQRGLWNGETFFIEGYQSEFETRLISLVIAAGGRRSYCVSGSSLILLGPYSHPMWREMAFRSEERGDALIVHWTWILSSLFDIPNYDIAHRLSSGNWKLKTSHETPLPSPPFTPPPSPPNSFLSPLSTHSQREFISRLALRIEDSTSPNVDLLPSAPRSLCPTSFKPIPPPHISQLSQSFHLELSDSQIISYGEDP